MHFYSLVKIFRVFNFCHVTPPMKNFWHRFFPNYGIFHIVLFCNAHQLRKSIFLNNHGNCEHSLHTTTFTFKQQQLYFAMFTAMRLQMFLWNWQTKERLICECFLANHTNEGDSLQFSFADDSQYTVNSPFHFLPSLFPS